MGTAASRIARATSSEKSIDIVLSDDQYDPVYYNGEHESSNANNRAMAPCACPTAACKPDAVWWESILRPRGPDQPGCNVPLTNQVKVYSSSIAIPVDQQEKDERFHTCSKVSVGRCPVLTDETGSISATRAVPCDPTKYDGRCVRCFYDAAKVARSCKMIEQYGQQKKEEVGCHPYNATSGSCEPFTSWFDDELMNRYCSTRGDPKLCPTHPGAKDFPTDASGRICSSMLTCPMCKQWALSKSAAASQQTDNLIDQWCRDHPTDPSCGCQRLMTDDYKLYSAMQAVTAAKPGCWYTPCIDKGFETDLVKSDMRTWSDCPKVICTNQVIIDGSTVDIKDLNQSIYCSADPDAPTCSPVCGVHGRCDKKSDGTTYCVCAAGWKGANCSTPDVAPPPDRCTLDCGTHGHCFSDTECSCQPGWTGSKCDVEEVNPEPTPAEKDWKKIAIVAGGSIVAIAGVVIILKSLRTKQ